MIPNFVKMYLLVEKLRYIPPIFRTPTYVGVYFHEEPFLINEQLKTNISAKFGAFIRDVNVSTIISTTALHPATFLRNRRRFQDISIEFVHYLRIYIATWWMFLQAEKSNLNLVNSNQSRIIMIQIWYGITRFRIDFFMWIQGHCLLQWIS